MNSERKLEQLWAVWTVLRHVAFWAKWVFVVGFVGPSVAVCMLLAVASDFSFTNLSQEVLEYVADAAKYPAAPDGFITIQTCKDPKPDGSQHVPVPSICKQLGFKQVSIPDAAQQVAAQLWAMYAVVFIVWSGALWMFGIFECSRRTFLQSVAATPVSAPT